MLGAKGATQLPVSHNSYLGNSISKAAHILQSATAPKLTLALPLSPAGQVQSACSHWLSRNPLALELSGSSESLIEGMIESLLHVLKVMPSGIVSRFYQVVVTVYSETNTTQSELKT